MNEPRVYYCRADVAAHIIFGYMRKFFGSAHKNHNIQHIIRLCVSAKFFGTCIPKNPLCVYLFSTQQAFGSHSADGWIEEAEKKRSCLHAFCMSQFAEFYTSFMRNRSCCSHPPDLWPQKYNKIHLFRCKYDINVKLTLKFFLERGAIVVKIHVQSKSIEWNRSNS